MLDLQAEMGLAYLFISHDMAVVERVSHRVAVMYLGEIVEIGPRAAIFGDPRHPYTKKLLAAVPVPDPARRGNPARGLERRDPQPDPRPRLRRPPSGSIARSPPGHVVQEWGTEWERPVSATVEAA